MCSRGLADTTILARRLVPRPNRRRAPAYTTTATGRFSLRCPRPRPSFDKPALTRRFFHLLALTPTTNGPTNPTSSPSKGSEGFLTTEHALALASLGSTTPTSTSPSEDSRTAEHDLTVSSFSLARPTLTPSLSTEGSWTTEHYLTVSLLSLTSDAIS